MAYFVLEKDADECGQYSPDGQVTFTNIIIQFNGQTVTPTWYTGVKDDVCNARAKIVNPSSVQITWDTS